MHRWLPTLSIVGLIVSACAAPAPATTAPTSPPPAPATTAPSPSPLTSASPSAAAKPATSPAPSPSLAVSPIASPSAAAAVASPSPGPAVTTALLFSGSATPGFTLQSSAFSAGGTLPSEFSCDGPGGGQSPPLSWSGAPATAKSFVLAEQDPDGPGGTANAVTHWLVYNIPSSVTQLEAGLPATPTLPNGALQGLSSRRAVGYLGACPPAGAAPHHYTFQLFALDTVLATPPSATLPDVQQAMAGHQVGQTDVVALFGR